MYSWYNNWANNYIECSGIRGTLVQPRNPEVIGNQLPVEW